MDAADGIFSGLSDSEFVDAVSLGASLGRCKVSIQRAARRGELPPPIKLMGRHVWKVGAIREHLANLQSNAIARAAALNSKRIA